MPFCPQPRRGSSPPARRRAVATAAVLTLAPGLFVLGATVSAGAAHAAAPVAAKGPLHVVPGGAGSRDGSSWRNAGDIRDLPRFVAARPRGGQVLVRGDLGPYRVDRSIDLKAGGSEGRPVVIRGVDGDGDSDARPVLRGARTSPYKPGGRRGSEVFKLYGGADDLVFRNLAFRDQGTAFAAAGSVARVTIEDVTAVNIRHFVNNYRSPRERNADVKDLTVRRVAVEGFSKSVLKLQYDSRRVLVEDVTADAQRQDRDDFAMGVHLDGAVRDVTLRRVTMRRSHDTLHDYWNGDGFATERGVRGVRFEDTLATGSTDGGYDLKSSDTTLVRARAEDNKRNFRFWGVDVRVEDCTGLAPRKRGGEGSQAQVWLGKRARVDMTGCTFRDDNPRTVVFDLDDGARLRLRDTRVHRASGAVLKRLDDRARIHE
jgi:hypothetical protein